MVETVSGKSHSYTFTDVSLTVGSRQLAVSAVVLRLQDSTIPSLKAIVDPKHTADEPNIPGTAPTLTDITTWCNEYMDMARERDVLCTFGMTVEDDEGNVQSISLVDWILVGAGISSANAHGGFALQLTMEHPITRIDRAPLSLGLIGQKIVWANAIDIGQVTNPITALATGLDYYAGLRRKVDGGTLNVGTAETSQSAQTAYERGTELIAAAASAVSTGLEWLPTHRGDTVYSSWPLQSELNTTLEAMQLMVAASPAQHTGYTPWELLVGLKDVWQFSIVPAFYSPGLPVRPYSPWASPELTIHGRNIANIAYPGLDPAPIGGVRAAGYSVMSTSEYGNWNNRSPRSTTRRSDVIYMPEAVRTGKITGRILEMREPSWLSQMPAAMAAGTHGLKSWLEMENQYSTLNAGPDTELEEGGDYDTQSRERDRLLYEAAHAYFLASYRASVQIMVQTNLLFFSPSDFPSSFTYTDSDDCAVLPGVVARIKSGASGEGVFEFYEGIFDFYVTGVIHSISFQGGRASTEIIGAYARPPDGITDMAANELNPLYAIGS